jgi:magnesium chelatase subunit D
MEAVDPLPDLWTDALMSAALLAADPVGVGGVVLRCPAGEVRQAWLAHLRRCLSSLGSAPVVQIPADVSNHQLLGGLDLERTLAESRPIWQQGALVRANGGVILAAMAERMNAPAAAVIGATMDMGMVEEAPARFALVACDEGIAPDERPPAGLAERLAMHLDLTGLTHREALGAETASFPDIALARARLSSVIVPDGVAEAVCAAAAALGIASNRAALLALRLIRAAAALDGLGIAGEAHLALAARLVLAPRAMRMPAPVPEDEQAAQPPPAEDGRAESVDPDQAKTLEDRLIDAATAAIPADLLAMIRNGARRAARASASGKSGDARKAELRGRPIGSRKGDLRSRARLDLLDTLRAAAPWQKLRGRAPDGPLKFRREDVRLRRYRDRQASTTIFVVDASGSAAMDRLGEAKGAVELLLADCYVRRDEVALVAFRGAGADILLPATRSLARAKRALAALPGGGGTPLASGLLTAERLADEAKRKGRTPTLVVITDGRANVCRDGLGGRQKAQEEAETIARLIRGQNRRAIVVDNAPRPEPRAKSLADIMGAAYLALPHASATALSGAVRAGAAS